MGKIQGRKSILYAFFKMNYKNFGAKIVLFSLNGKKPA